VDVDVFVGDIGREAESVEEMFGYKSKSTTLWGVSEENVSKECSEWSWDVTVGPLETYGIPWLGNNWSYIGVPAGLASDARVFFKGKTISWKTTSLLWIFFGYQYHIIYTLLNQKCI